VFDDIFQVIGQFALKFGPIAIRGNRNMTIVRQADELTLINTVRMDEKGLAQLDALGMVKHIIRVGAFHGMDDPFYKERYGAHVWSVDTPYNATLNAVARPEDIYFEPDTWVTSGSVLPIADAEFIEISDCTPKESVILLQREGGIVLPGDSFQNMDPHGPELNLITTIFHRLGGFRRAHNIGPGWYRVAKPDMDEVAKILDRGFAHLLPAHGRPVLGNAAKLYRMRVEELQRKQAR
jgi:hypothetical protein